MSKPVLSTFFKVAPPLEEVVDAKILRGRKGDAGEKGEKGDKGDTGDRGSEGERGEIGARGLAGTKGEKGDKGERGEEGSPDTGAVIVKKINASKSKIKRDSIEGMEEIEGLAKSANANVKRYIQMGGSPLIGIQSASGATQRVDTINFLSGFTVTPVGQGTQVNVTASGGGGFTVLVPTGMVDGSNQTFVFASAPSVIVVDQSRVMVQTSRDLNANWTGTTTVVMQIAPNSDIFGY